MSDVTAIVVSYFTGPALTRCIESLRADAAIKSIILVDNGNPDGAIAAAIADSDIPVTVLAGHGNIGFAAACNLGAKETHTEYMLFINPDATLEAGGATAMLAHANGLVRPWVIGPRLLDPDGNEQQGSRRAALTPWRALVEVLGLYRFARLERFNWHEAPLPDGMTAIPTLSGACFLIATDDYRMIGGMDVGYFLHVEDIDFFERFRGAGGTCWFDPSVAVTHLKGASAAAEAEVEAHKTRGLIRFFKTHFRGTYPAPVLWALSAALWFSYGVKRVIRPR